MMGKIKFALIMLLLLSGQAGAWSTCAAAPPPMDTVSDLWLDVRVLNPFLADLFKRLARPGDIARVENIEDLPLLRDIGVGRKLVVFKSVAEAEQFMPIVAGQVDIIGYNLEHGPANPRGEQDRPVDSARRMRELADQYGLKLAFGPDHDFALSDGVEIAPYVDIFVLQVQLAQREPRRVYEFVLPLIPKLRQANPNLEISVQVRTEGDSKEDLTAIVDLVDSLRDNNDHLSLDGVSVLTSRETVANAEMLINELHRRDWVAPRPASLQPYWNAPEGGAPGPGAGAAQNAPPAGSETGFPAAQGPQIPWQLIMLGSLVVGAVIGGATVALIYALQKQSNRGR